MFSDLTNTRIILDATLGPIATAIDPQKIPIITSGTQVAICAEHGPVACDVDHLGVVCDHFDVPLGDAIQSLELTGEWHVNGDDDDYIVILADYVGEDEDDAALLDDAEAAAVDAAWEASFLADMAAANAAVDGIKSNVVTIEAYLRRTLGLTRRQ